LRRLSEFTAFTAFTALPALLLFDAGAARAEQSPSAQVQPALGRWMLGEVSPGRDAVSTSADAVWLDSAIDADGRVRVVLHPRIEAEASADASERCARAADLLLSRLGSMDRCDIVSPRPEAIEIVVSREQLGEIAAFAEVDYIGLAAPPLPLARSQAIDAMRTPEFAAWGYHGKDVRVGVIDIGFAGYEERLGTELPSSVVTRSFFNGANGTGDLTGRGEPHGVACAEVLHDVAPEASLYFSNVSSVGDFQRAVEWMIQEGVEVISHSLAWFYGGGDGSGPVGDIVELAEREGVLFVTSAGNFAQSHWSGEFADADSDGFVEVDDIGGESIGLPTIEGGDDIVSLVLVWSRWPSSTSLDFEIDIRTGAGDGEVLATSEFAFEGYPYALRQVVYDPSEKTDGARIHVRHQRGTATGVTLRIFRIDGGPLADHRVPSGSLAFPGDSPAALTVGAFDWTAEADEQRLSVFSSYGPTLDGRAKPELLGASGIASSVYQPNSANGFSGTSAACPHVAGAAALILSASIRGGLFDTRWTIDEVRALLRDAALPLAGDPPPEAVGAGRVRLPLERLSTPRETSPFNLTFDRWNAGGPRFELSAPSAFAPQPLRVVDVAGRALASIPPSNGSAVSFRWDSALTQSLPRGRYWAIEPSSAARVSFYWDGVR